MENFVLTIGGLIKNLNWSDLFFFASGVILMLLLSYIIYLVRADDEDIMASMLPERNKEEKPTKKEEINKTLEEIIDNLETNYEPKPIDLSKYEQEMEDTAIISYDELVSRASNNITYEDEYDSGFDDIVVKKVDATNLSNTRELVPIPKAVMMNYDSEEEFLSALKELQKNLVR